MLQQKCDSAVSMKVSLVFAAVLQAVMLYVRALAMECKFGFYTLFHDTDVHLCYYICVIYLWLKGKSSYTTYTTWLHGADARTLTKKIVDLAPPQTFPPCPLERVRAKQEVRLVTLIFYIDITEVHRLALFSSLKFIRMEIQLNVLTNTILSCLDTSC